MHVILEYRDPDRPRKAHIVAIHDSAELAQQLVSDDESDRKLESLECATTYDQAAVMDISDALVLATGGARPLVDSLSATNVGIYADTFTAAKEFPELAGQQQLCPTVDTEADPLAAYHTRDRQ